MQPKAKVLFRVPNGDGSANVETLWAYALGSDKYRLDNLPFYAYAVSADDVVFAPVNPEENIPTFIRVVSKSGNRTIRVIFEEPVAPGSRSQAVLDGLVSCGCSYEGANRHYIAINIPAAIDLAQIASSLTEKNIQWEHADPTYEEYCSADN